MDVHASEKEQIEALKNWWKKDGSSVITGLLLGLSVLLGGKAWFSYQDSQVAKASDLYAQMMTDLSAQKNEQVRKRANEIISNHSGTGYAPLAALVLARLAVDNGQPAAAQVQLAWALAHADSDQVRHVARLRLVRVLIEQQAWDAAADQLAGVGDKGAYQYLYSELEGDLALAQGQTDKARSAYKAALDAMPPQSPAAGFLTTKYENLALAGAEDAAR